MSYSTPSYGYSASTALPLIAQYESGGGVPGGIDYGAYNYLYNTNPSYYSATGAYQIVNSTWQQALQWAGLGSLASTYPTAVSAPPGVQDQAAAALFNNLGFGPWSGDTALMNAVSTGQAGGASGSGGTTDTTTGTTGAASQATPQGWIGAIEGAAGNLAARAGVFILAIILLIGAMWLFALRTQATAEAPS